MSAMEKLCGGGGATFLVELNSTLMSYGFRLHVVKAEQIL